MSHLYGASDRLPESQYERIQLHYWQDCTLAEIAERMDRTPRGFGGRAALAFDGNRLAVSDDDGIINVWDVTSGRVQWALARLKDMQLRLPVFPSGWPQMELLSDDLLRTPLIGHGGPVRSITFCPDGKTITSASS